MVTALVTLCIVLAVCCVLLALRRRGRLTTLFGRELDYQTLVREHAVLGMAVLVVAVVHAVGMFAYASSAQLASGVAMIALLAVEVVLGMAMFSRPGLRTGPAGRVHRLVAVVLAVLVVVHVVLAVR